MKLFSKSFFIVAFTIIFSYKCTSKVDLLSDFTDENIESDSIFLNDENFIDINEALSLAKQFMDWNSKNNMKSSEMDRILKQSSVIRSKKMNKNFKSKSDTLMYIFNYNKGFTIVSATKNIYPILAFSEDNSFEENHTENIGPSIWLNYMSDRIEKIVESPEKKENNADIYNLMLFEENDQADVLLRAQFYDEIRNHKEVGPLLSTKWHQGFPFNMNTPTINGKEAPAGCVPVALGQVINFHRVFFDENIDWTAIKNGVNSDIGHFISIISDGVEMSYKETYAHPSLCIPNFFCYRGRIADYLYCKGYNVSWADLGSQTPVTCPAIYEGFTSNFVGTTNWFGGHWWVMDGYKKWEWWYGWAETENPIEPRSYSQLKNNLQFNQNPPLSVTYFLYLHFNWGWNGQHDGWYGVAGSYLDYCKSFKRLDIRKR